MDKINNISFTGIKNVAVCQFQRNRQSFSSALSMCLTDDVNGKDLSEFHSMVKKVATKPNQFEHYNGSDVVNIEHYAQNDGTALFLNGDEVKINDELNDINFSTELLTISKLDYISDDIEVLANLAVYVNYQMYPNSPKSFCWDLFGDGILLNIYDNSNKDFYIPLETKGGNIEYMGKQYQNKKVVIDYDNF